jgi:hypothetical protein
MGLWANDTFSEFGIQLNSELVVKTRETANLIKMIDGSPYKDGYDHQWHYTLAQWVIFYLANKYLISKVLEKRNFTPKPPDEELLSKLSATVVLGQKSTTTV